MSRSALVLWGRRVGFTFLSLIGIALAVAVLQPFWLAPWVAHRLTATSGRAVHFDSMWVGLGGSFEPVVHWRGVRIENAAWADAGRPFAALDEAVAYLSWRSIADERPVIALLVLRGGQVDLERQADGLRNWRLRNPEDRGPGHIRVMALRAERATVRFVHRGLDLELEATASPNNAVAVASAATAASAPTPTHLELKGGWRKLAFHASLDTDEVLTFLETGRTFALRGHLEAGGARLELDGRAGDIVREPIVDARVSLAGNTLAPFHAFLGPRGGQTKAFRVEGRIQAGDHAYSLTDAQARIGATDLAGDAAFRQAEPRNAVRLKLRSASTDVADLLWLAGRGDGQHRAPAAARGAAAAAPAAASAAGFDSARARAADAEFDFEARRFHAAEFPLLQSVKVQAALADGRLALNAFDLGLAKGHATGHAALDLREPSMTVEADVRAHGLRLEALLPEQKAAKRVTGSLQARVEVKTAGDSLAALLASASGSITATLADATISSLLDAEMGLQGGKILRSMITGAEPIAIGCAAMVLDLQRGSGRVRTLVIDTEHTRTTGTGTIGLRDRTLDLVLTPQAKQGGLFVLDRSIRLHGPLSKPQHSLVDRAAPMAGRACAG